MPTHFVGPDSQKRALDTYIKLMRAAESVARRALSCLQDSGLTEGQFGVLEALHHLGPLKLSDLARKHLRSPNNLTVIVDNLEKNGLVRRQRCEHDRRIVFVHLTEPGELLITSLFPKHAEAVAKEMSLLTEEERELLDGLLRRLGKGVG
ncbi:MarR family transcriptional regulator [Armatimonas sp.]|uniref:MarR family winged helix-turn-helix transcriptional regulator n=1 Tax=Armatimonas sp. TaxID=1872638 RepID=UPI00286A439B|nr:MarR family transcriptional regulator [Armatimonas sp.]